MPHDPVLRHRKFAQYKWPILTTDLELPRIYQYRRYRREHLKVFEANRVVDIVTVTEPIILPPSPNDSDYVDENDGEEEDEEGGWLEFPDESEDSLYSQEPVRSPAANKRRGGSSSRGRGRKRVRPPTREPSPTSYGLRKRKTTKAIHNNSNNINSEDNDEDDDDDDDGASEEYDAEDRIEADELRLQFNTSVQHEIPLDRPWALLINQIGAYFPQVNDPIMYIDSGYREHLTQLGLPFPRPTLQPIEPGWVRNVRFRLIMGHGAACEIRVALVNKNLTMWLQLGKKLPRFLVHKERFDWASRYPWRIGMRVKVLHKNDDIIRTIVGIQQRERGDPWNTIM